MSVREAKSTAKGKCGRDDNNNKRKKEIRGNLRHTNVGKVRKAKLVIVLVVWGSLSDVF